jgi:hypothetical protein
MLRNRQPTGKRKLLQKAEMAAARAETSCDRRRSDIARFVAAL